MKRLAFVAMLAVLFTACEKKDSEVVSTNLTATTTNQYTILHSFNSTQGASPNGGLLLSGSTLYGLTMAGGANSVGTIFSINTDGSGFTDMHDFKGTDGSEPQYDLTLSGNTLYGTTRVGGLYNAGEIFTINTDGSGFKVIYNFGTGISQYPVGDLTISGNVMYGATSGGGAYGYGNIYSIATNGSGYLDMYDIPYTMQAYPMGLLTLSGNTLYGIAYVMSSEISYIFSIRTNSTDFKILYTFDGSTGYAPEGNLFVNGSSIYGVTYVGGNNGEGMVYSIDTAGGSFADIYDFNPDNGPDNPCTGLAVSGNTFYGFTGNGYVGSGYNDEGNIYSLQTNGSNFNNLYNFSGNNGASPGAGTPVISNGKVYGMTIAGGSGGYGVIFSYSLQ